VSVSYFLGSTLGHPRQTYSAQTQKLEALKIHKKGLMQGLFPQETGSEKFEVRSEK